MDILPFDARRVPAKPDPLQAEVERLEAELSAVRQLHHEDGTVRVPRALAVALELLDRDLAAYREQQARWTAHRATSQDCLEAYQRVVQAHALVSKVRKVKPWPEVQDMTVGELRELAEAAVRP